MRLKLTSLWGLSGMPWRRPAAAARPNGGGLEALEPRCLLAGSLSAEFVWVDNAEALSGYVTADLEVTTDSDWTSAALLIELSQGAIYQDGNGSVRAPDDSLFGGMPTLEFDTYLAADDNTIFVAGAAVDVGGDAYRFDTSEIDVLWFDTALDDTGTVNLGRFTLSDDAEGAWSLRVVNAAGEVFTDTGVFTGGELAEALDPDPKGDLTGDGLVDIIWRDSRNGRNKVWRMDGTQRVEVINIKPAKDTDWKLVGTGDFTGDGKEDLLWRHVTDGSNAIWQMNGTDYVSAVFIPERTNLNWVVGGVGDFTGDGKSDILWRNQKNGKNAVWEMDGTAYQREIELVRLRNSKWYAAAVGDLTGDGKVDILWRHGRKGINTVWQMDGSALVGAIPIQKLANNKWQVAGLGDFTGDGRLDILWRHTGNGRNAVWQMQDALYLAVINLPDEDNQYKQPAGPILGLWEP